MGFSATWTWALVLEKAADNVNLPTHWTLEGGVVPPPVLFLAESLWMEFFGFH